MPTPLKHSENQRKHLTARERAARRAAESGLERARVTLRAPAWLGEDARKVFEDTKRKMRGLQVLDNVDSEALAIYADTIVKYRALSKVISKTNEEGESLASKEQVQACQAWARIVFSFSEKLGLTPGARARLARRKAENTPPDPLEQLLDDVNYFVNSGGKNEL